MAKHRSTFIEHISFGSAETAPGDDAVQMRMMVQRLPSAVQHRNSADLRAEMSPEVIDGSRETLSDGVRRITGGDGVDIVIDAIGGEIFSEALTTLAPEAQDLDDYRMRILQGLSPACHVVAAADAFQCLQNGRDTAPLMGWLEGAGQTHRLTLVRRTNHQGLLAAALAVREGRDVKTVLTARTAQNKTTWNGAGFRLLDAPATQRNTGLLAWAIANDISQRQGHVGILTPDAGNAIVRAALNTVQTRQWPRNNGATFGPYPHTWDRHDNEEADALLADIALPAAASCADLCALLGPSAGHAAIAQVINRMDRLRRTRGQAAFTAAQVTQLVRESMRNRSRLGFRPQQRGHLAMTIQRAKNRKFPNVIVLWPHTVVGSPEHLRRLLYNGITRAQNHCTVIVLGQGRLDTPPFGPADGQP